MSFFASIRSKSSQKSKRTKERDWIPGTWITKPLQDNLLLSHHALLISYNEETNGGYIIDFNQKASTQVQEKENNGICTIQTIKNIDDWYIKHEPEYNKGLKIVDRAIQDVGKEEAYTVLQENCEKYVARWYEYKNENISTQAQVAYSTAVLGVFVGFASYISEINIYSSAAVEATTGYVSSLMDELKLMNAPKEIIENLSKTSGQITAKDIPHVMSAVATQIKEAGGDSMQEVVNKIGDLAGTSGDISDQSQELAVALKEAAGWIGKRWAKRKNKGKYLNKFKQVFGGVTKAKEIEIESKTSINAVENSTVNAVKSVKVLNEQVDSNWLKSKNVIIGGVVCIGTLLAIGAACYWYKYYYKKDEEQKIKMNAQQKEFLIKIESHLKIIVYRNNAINKISDVKKELKNEIYQHLNPEGPLNICKNIIEGEDEKNENNQVLEMLQSIKMEQYFSKFTQQGIDDKETFLESFSSRDDLEDVGVHLIGHKAKIWKLIQTLKKTNDLIK